MRIRKGRKLCTNTQWQHNLADRCMLLQIKEILVEESNVQPVNSPVTVRANRFVAAALC